MAQWIARRVEYQCDHGSRASARFVDTSVDLAETSEEMNLSQREPMKRCVGCRAKPPGTRGRARHSDHSDLYDEFGAAHMIAVDTSAIVAARAWRSRAERFQSSRLRLRASASSARRPLFESAIWSLAWSRSMTTAAFIDSVHRARRSIRDALSPLRQAVFRRPASPSIASARAAAIPAGLNFGDCMAYAVAKTHDVPLLYKGGDFSSTDITPALP